MAELLGRYSKRSRREPLEYLLPPENIGLKTAAAVRHLDEILLRLRRQNKI
ncbi:MAG TPA: hypothetical protein VF113_12590 [Stellaceae bacterium]